MLMLLLMYISQFIGAFVSVNIGLEAFGYRLINFPRLIKIVIGIAGLFNFVLLYTQAFGPKGKMFQKLPDGTIIEVRNPAKDFLLFSQATSVTEGDPVK